MLDLAVKYKTQLQNLDLSTVDDPKYMFYVNSSYYSPQEIEDSDWSSIQRISIYNSEIKGFLSATIDRDSNIVINLSLVRYNLDKNSFIFMKDTECFIDYLFVYKQFRKIKFWCFNKNLPSVKLCEGLLVKTLGARSVGYYEYDQKLPDGNYYSKNLYEITREAYMKNRRLK